MITKIYLGTHKFANAIDMRQPILLEETNPINGNKSYEQLSARLLIEHINDIRNENNYLKEIAVECGYLICSQCGQVIHKDDADWSEKEQDYVCKDCKE